MPYPLEHSYDILKKTSPHTTIKRTIGGYLLNGIETPKNVSLIWFIQKDKSEIQSIRFPSKEWTEEQAKDWIEISKIKGEFETASVSQPHTNLTTTDSKKILDIAIHSEIGGPNGISSQDIKEKLQDTTINTIFLDINSPGGSVFEGMAIFNALKAHPATKHTKITGVCASIASIVAMAGDTIEMTENSMMLIHSPSVTVNGNSDVLRREADVLDKMQKSIVSIYRSKLTDKSDESIEQLGKLMNEQTWISPEEAKKMGFCDIITNTITDHFEYFDFSQFNYSSVPELILNRYDINSNEPIDATHIKQIKEFTFEKLIENLKNIFQLKKEIEMPIPKTVEELSEELALVITENEELKAKIAADIKDAEGDNPSEEELKKLVTELEEKVAKLENAIETTEKEVEIENKAARDKENKEYVDKLVADGKVLPIAAKIHCDILESRNADEAGLKEYKDMLEALPVAISVGSHVANSERAIDKDINATVETKAKELFAKYKANNNSVSYGDCLKEAALAK
ncbi:MAG TPA: head maturation protease, ClpP-related [Candidatus Glassbacteria bacterium]|nr:head maturation protease, ClpP-related [Candidatus Glassbacteria bacterium]